MTSNSTDANETTRLFHEWPAPVREAYHSLLRATNPINGYPVEAGKRRADQLLAIARKHGVSCDELFRHAAGVNSNQSR